MLLHGSLLVLLDLSRAMSILDDVYIGENNEPFGHHLIHDRQETLQLFLGIDYREHDRAVMREVERFVLVNSALGSVAKDAPIHRNSGQIVSSHGANKSLKERLIFPLIALADVDPHHFCL